MKKHNKQNRHQKIYLYQIPNYQIKMNKNPLRYVRYDKKNLNTLILILKITFEKTDLNMVFMKLSIDKRTTKKIYSISDKLENNLFVLYVSKNTIKII